MIRVTQALIVLFALSSLLSIGLRACRSDGTKLNSEVDDRAAVGGQNTDTPKSIARRTAQNGQGRVLSDLGYISIPLERLRGGHFVVRASVNGHHIRLIVDTGSPVVCLDPYRTKNSGLDWIDVTPGRNKDVIWELGISCKISILAIGDVSAKQLTAYGFNASRWNQELDATEQLPIDGLLGGNVLEALGAVIDVKDLRLYLRPGSVTIESSRK